jgi:tetratricopeptide (TPR) repeat protein
MPSNTEARLSLVNVKIRQGKIKDALRQANRAVEDDPSNAEAAAIQIRLLLLTGEPAKAVKQARVLAKQNPDDIDIQNLVLFSLVRNGRAQLVLREGRILLRRDETNTETMRNIARAYIKLNKLETARYVLKRANSVQEEADTHRLLGEVYYRLDDLSTARQYLQKALDAQRNAPEILNNLGLIATQMADFTGAEQYLLELTARYPGLSFPFANLGYLYRLQGKPDDAIAAYRQALSMNSSFADVHYNLGLLYLDTDLSGMEGQQRFKSAIESLNKYRDLRRNELDRKENEQLDKFIQEAKRWIDMLNQREEEDRREREQESSEPSDDMGDSDGDGDGDGDDMNDNDAPTQPPAEPEVTPPAPAPAEPSPPPKPNDDWGDDDDWGDE